MNNISINIGLLFLGIIIGAFLQYNKKIIDKILGFKRKI
jgi:hypothetical protein